jgi:hypothetical protein
MTTRDGGAPASPSWSLGRATVGAHGGATGQRGQFGRVI